MRDEPKRYEGHTFEFEKVIASLYAVLFTMLVAAAILNPVGTPDATSPVAIEASASARQN